MRKIILFTILTIFGACAMPRELEMKPEFHATNPATLRKMPKVECSRTPAGKDICHSLKD